MEQTQQGPPAPSNTPPPAPAGQNSAGAQDAIITGIVRTGPWARFMAVLGFISVGLMCFGGLVVMLAGGAAGDIGLGVGFAMGFFYIAMAAVYLIPVIALNHFASEASRLRWEPSSAGAARAIEQARSFWMRIGILSIISLALVPVVLFLSIFVAIASR